MKRLSASCIVWILTLLIAGLAAGCVSRYDEEQKLRDLDFIVVDREDEPEELSTMIEEEKGTSIPDTLCGSGAAISCGGVRRTADHRIQCSGPGTV